MEIAKLKTLFLLTYSNCYSIHFQDQREQPHITKRRRTLATTRTTEEEEEEVVVTPGEDKEEAKDKVGGASGKTLSTEAMDNATAMQWQRQWKV